MGNGGGLAFVEVELLEEPKISSSKGFVCFNRLGQWAEIMIYVQFKHSDNLEAAFCGIWLEILSNVVDEIFSD